MRALSVKEPWASLIIKHGKTTENRTWYTPHRGPLVICASKIWEDWDYESWADLMNEIHPGTQWIGGRIPTMRQMILPGFALGVVCIVSCGRDTVKTTWDEPEKYHWRLTNPVPFLKPFPFTGRLGLYDIPNDVISRALPPDWTVERLSSQAYRCGVIA